MSILASFMESYFAIWLPTTSLGFLKVTVSLVDFALVAGMRPCTAKSSTSTCHVASFSISASAKALTVAIIRQPSDA